MLTETTLTNGGEILAAAQPDPPGPEPDAPTVDDVPDARDAAPAGAGEVELVQARPDPQAATAGEVVQLFAEATACAGDALSYTVTGQIREAWVHLPDAATWQRWCAFLHIDSATYAEDRVTGAGATAAVARYGWTLRLCLFGSAVAGLP